VFEGGHDQPVDALRDASMHSLQVAARGCDMKIYHNPGSCLFTCVHGMSILQPPACYILPANQLCIVCVCVPLQMMLLRTFHRVSEGCSEPRKG
jgi:hypothetical protein